MEYLYKTGIVSAHLQHLKDEKSYFDIEYAIDNVQPLIVQRLTTEVSEEVTNNLEERQQDIEINKINLSMVKIDDHKRQLTFCDTDLPQNMAYTKILLNEQLKLLKVLEKIYLTLLKLERSGHPNYQLKTLTYKMFDEAGKLHILAFLYRFL